MTTLLELVTFCILLRYIGTARAGKNLEQTQSFDVKPSGQIVHQTIGLDNGVRCIFTYAAVGGTNEEWSINLRKVKRKKLYTCTIERPDQTSYLFFTNFALSILEHDVYRAEVFDNSGALLQDEEYIITDDGKSVQHKEGGFKSNLSRVVLTAGTTKTN